MPILSNSWGRGRASIVRHHEHVQTVVLSSNRNAHRRLNDFRGSRNMSVVLCVWVRSEAHNERC